MFTNYLYILGKAGVNADENWFLSSFKDVKRIKIPNQKEFDSFTTKILMDLKSGTEQWEKKLRAVSITSLFYCHLGLLIQLCLRVHLIRSKKLANVVGSGH